MSSVHDKLNRVRKPRVHVTYEVETGDAQVLRELPMVVGVLGDFSGNDPGEPLPSMRERKFVQIDRDTFDQVMSRITPGVSMRVKDTLSGEDDKELAVSLKMRSIQDFEPAAVVEQVEPLRKLRETRDRLAELVNKVDRSDELEGLLEQVLQDQEKRDALADQLGLKGDSNGGEEQ